MLNSDVKVNEKQVKASKEVGASKVARSARQQTYSHVPNGRTFSGSHPVFTKEPKSNSAQLLLRTLCAVEGAALHALGNASSIESTADDVVTNAGQVADLAATDQDNRVLLQVVTDTGDVASTFDGVRQTNTGNLTQSGVGLLGRRGLDAQETPRF